jgi:lysophospholipase L1-like esterase
MTYAASKYPWAGWGQEIGYYFKTGSVTVINHAVGGRSSRSFVNKGNWASTLADMQSGDWLFIQFGHNDRDYTDTTRYTDTATYKKYLAMYIDSARSKGVHPVLVTPMNMNTWTDTATK